MAAQKKPPRIVNLEVSQMIEDMLYEIVPSIDKLNAKRVARQLSSLRAFQSLDKNTEREDLKTQLKKQSKQLLQIAEQRRRNRQQRQKSFKSTGAVEEVSSKITRYPKEAGIDQHHILRNSLGEKKYEEIIFVYQEIKQIRQQSAVWTKFSRARCEEGEDRAPASKALPGPISDLYFRTRLMDVIPRVTCIVQRLDWDLLLEDAKAKLSAFRKFEMENVNEDDHLSFHCSQGICHKSCA